MRNVNERIARALGIDTTVWTPDCEHDPAACVSVWPTLADVLREGFVSKVIIRPCHFKTGKWYMKIDWCGMVRCEKYFDSFCAAWCRAACEILGIVVES